MAKKKNSLNDEDPNGQISTQLRQLYKSVQDEEIPDRFLDLLEQLDAAEQDSGDATDVKNQ